jgi:hypothetical protein
LFDAIGVYVCYLYTVRDNFTAVNLSQCPQKLFQGSYPFRYRGYVVTLNTDAPCLNIDRENPITYQSNQCQFSLSCCNCCGGGLHRGWRQFLVGIFPELLEPWALFCPNLIRRYANHAVTSFCKRFIPPMIKVALLLRLVLVTIYLDYESTTI